MFPTDLSQYRYALPIPNKYGRPHKDKVFAPIYIHEQLVRIMMASLVTAYGLHTTC
jgi:hypothetical protein